MTTLRCNATGCDYTASHMNPNVAKAMLGRHKRFVHGIIGGYKPKHPKADQVRTSEVEVEKPRKPYTRKAAGLGVNYCPCCGVNLRAVAVAMNMKV